MEELQMPIRYEVDLDAPLAIRRLPTLLMEGDAYANAVEITVKKGGNYFTDLESLSVMGYFTRADGQDEILAGDIAGDVIRMEMTPGVYEVAGQCTLRVQLTGQTTGVWRTILLAVGRVEARGHGPILDASQRLPTLDDLLAAAGMAISAAGRVPWMWASNLLDNSYFVRPVNTEGKTSYTGAANTYTIARWLKSTAAVAVTLNASGINIDNRTSTSANGHMTQRLEKVPDGVYTLCAGTSSGTILRTFTLSGGTLTQGVVNNAGAAFTAVGYSNGILTVQLGVQAGNVVTVYWAGLYPGTYTLADLPAYMPKPPVIEEAECMRYYQIRSTNNVPAVDMRPQMRLANPTITQLSDGTYAYDANL